MVSHASKTDVTQKLPESQAKQASQAICNSRKNDNILLQGDLGALDGGPCEREPWDDLHRQAAVHLENWLARQNCATCV